LENRIPNPVEKRSREQKRNHPQCWASGILHLNRLRRGGRERLLADREGSEDLGLNRFLSVTDGLWIDFEVDVARNLMIVKVRLIDSPPLSPWSEFYF